MGGSKGRNKQPLPRLSHSPTAGTPRGEDQVLSAMEAHLVDEMNSFAPRKDCDFSENQVKQIRELLQEQLDNMREMVCAAIREGKTRSRTNGDSTEKQFKTQRSNRDSFSSAQSDPYAADNGIGGSQGVFNSLKKTTSSLSSNIGPPAHAPNTPDSNHPEGSDWETEQLENQTPTEEDTRPTFYRQLSRVVEGYVLWEWQSTSTKRWHAYSKELCVRIEQAFRSGRSIAHIKQRANGKNTPLEVFFADMVQYDPVTEHMRSVRRKGETELLFRKHPWTCVSRNAKALALEIFKGQPQHESVESHRERRKEVLQRLAIGKTIFLHDEDRFADSISKRSKKASSKRLLTNSNFFARIVECRAFMAVSMIVTVLQLFWTTRATSSMTPVHMFKEDTTDIACEVMFYLYFLVEMIVRCLAMKRSLEIYRQPWLSFDVICTLLSTIELCIVPVLYSFEWISDNATTRRWLATFSVGRLFRFLRVIRFFPGFQEPLKGFFHGLTSASQILVLLAAFTYAFSFFFMATIQDAYVREDFFSNVFHGFRTLSINGVLTDNFGDLYLGLWHAGEVVAAIFLVAYTALTYFGLANMVIGVFCGTAMQVADMEKDDASRKILEDNLKDILECYIDEDSTTMEKKHFGLILQNFDVINALTECGTDVEALSRLEDDLFPEQDSTIPISKFFQVVVRMRAGTPACVSHVVGFTTKMEQRFDRLENMLFDSDTVPPDFSRQRPSYLDAIAVR